MTDAPWADTLWLANCTKNSTPSKEKQEHLSTSALRGSQSPPSDGLGAVRPGAQRRGAGQRLAAVAQAREREGRVRALAAARAGPARRRQQPHQRACGVRGTLGARLDWKPSYALFKVAGSAALPIVRIAFAAALVLSMLTQGSGRKTMSERETCPKHSTERPTWFIPSSKCPKTTRTLRDAGRYCSTPKG